MLSPASNLEELLEQMHEVFKGVNKTVGDLEAKVTSLPTQGDLNRMEKAVKAEAHDDVKEQIGYVRQAILSDVQGALQEFKDTLNQHQHAVGEMIRSHKESVRDLIHEFKAEVPDIVDERTPAKVTEILNHQKKKRREAMNEAVQRWRNRVLLVTAILSLGFAAWQWFANASEVSRLKEAAGVTRSLDRALSK
jgi:uncharacterized protein YicC (UPF0701 family)